MPSLLSWMVAFFGFPSGSCDQTFHVILHSVLLFRKYCVIGRKTYQNLHSEQSLSSVTSINGELNRQASGYTFGIETRATGTYFTGVVPRLRHYLEWTVGEASSKYNYIFSVTKR